MKRKKVEEIKKFEPVYGIAVLNASNEIDIYYFYNKVDYSKIKDILKDCNITHATFMAYVEYQKPIEG